MSRTIVFIHGNFVTRRCWDGWVARYEARGHRCITIAYPGRDRPVAELKRNLHDPQLGALTIRQTIDHHVAAIAAIGEKPIIMGHSFGGLLTQLMVQRDLASAAVAIDSVPPQGVLPFEWSFIRSTWPIVNPFIPASRPWYMSLEQFSYAFVNDLPPAEQKEVYDREVVPESRRLGRGGLTSAARVDFRRPHAPLLLIAGEKDHIMPAALNRRNYERYRKGSSSVTEFRMFKGRAHYSILSGRRWEEVADYALDWAIRAVPSKAEATTPADPNGAVHAAVRPASVPAR